ncbi:hypothetical protein Tdes44962_MAKER02492 [Teratosphaeria destructans]|uniref:Uncharacterized protein n=1 Tax=Teratosphaeria destructans TaxID=418781 RepID=A0A9W7STP7_9PEZI|nr:hypothetical protein Tdes44962_MAKER02492 [Teratosphaeria destructans]
MRFLLTSLPLLPFAAAGTNLWRGFYCADPVPGQHATQKNLYASQGTCSFMKNAGVHVHWAPEKGENGVCWQNTPGDWINGVTFKGLCPNSGAHFAIGLEEKPR